MPGYHGVAHSHTFCIWLAGPRVSCELSKYTYSPPITHLRPQAAPSRLQLWSPLNHLLTHVILVRAACGSNIRTAIASSKPCTQHRSPAFVLYIIAAAVHAPRRICMHQHAMCPGCGVMLHQVVSSAGCIRLHVASGCIFLLFSVMWSALRMHD